MRILQSLFRGLQALDYISDHGQPVRLTDVAEALGIEKSKAAHILKTLVAAEYAEQDDGRRYRTTPKLVTSNPRQHTLDEIIACKETWRPALERLVAETSECAHMAVLVKSQVWYIDKIDSSLTLKVDHPIGTLAPLHCTALGKAFLAFGSAIPEDPLPKFTPRTITSKDRLQQEIQTTQQRGYAIDNEEFSEGIRCVARAVHDTEGSMIAAIGVSGPTARIDDDRLMEIGKILRNMTTQ